jgi:hypothetical protein
MQGFIKLIVDFLGLLWARGQALATVHFLATKTVLITLFLTALPILFNNFLYGIMEMVIQLTSGVTLPSIGSPSFTGLGGYLMEKFRIIDCVSMMLTAYGYRLTIKLLTLGRL